MSQRQRIRDAITHCEEVIASTTCKGCRDDHQNLKECLEFTLDTIPLLDDGGKVVKIECGNADCPHNKKFICSKNGIRIAYPSCKCMEYGGSRKS